MPRQGDFDGRGNLSLKALNSFIEWFLDICIDQVSFKEQLFELDVLLSRLAKYCNQNNWKPEAFNIIEAVLFRGELNRGDAARISGLKERSARQLLSTLTEHGLLGSKTPKGPVSLIFPSESLDILFPNLFPASVL